MPSPFHRLLGFSRAACFSGRIITGSPGLRSPAPNVLSSVLGGGFLRRPCSSPEGTLGRPSPRPRTGTRFHRRSLSDPWPRFPSVTALSTDINDPMSVLILLPSVSFHTKHQAPEAAGLVCLVPGLSARSSTQHAADPWVLDFMSEILGHVGFYT